MRSKFAVITASLALIGVAATLGASPALAATTYYVSPTGSGSACTQASPCALLHALGAALSGDTIVLAGNDGSYGTSGSPITQEIDIPDGVTLTGDTSKAMPVIYDNNTSGLADSGVYVEGASSILDDVDIEWSGSFAAVTGVGTWNRVIADAGSGSGCTFDAGTTTVTDSLCAGSYAGVYDNWNGSSGTSDFFANLYNDTIVSPGYGMFLDAESVHIDIAMNLENTIVRSTAASSPTDMYLTEVGACGIAQVTASYSNYANVTVGDNTCGNVAYTPVGTANGQTASPLFVNTATNNFAEASGSPTIGAGTNDTANDGSLDLAGALRDIAGRTDIGAYELVHAPVVASGAPSAIGTAGGTVNGTVNPNGANTTYHVDYGTSPSYGSSTGSQSLTPSASAQAVAVSIGGLAPSTTYHYRVVATNSGGSTDGPDETFTTASPPPVAPAISAFTQSHTRWRLGSVLATFARTHHKHRASSPVGTTFTVTLNEPATLELTFSRSASGRRGINGTCVAPTKHNKHRPKCTYQQRYSLPSSAAHAGTNTVTFDGVLASASKLSPGTYTATATATASALSSQPTSLTFTVVKH